MRSCLFLFFLSSVLSLRGQSSIDSLQQLSWNDYLYLSQRFQAFINDPNYWTSRILEEVRPYRSWIAVVFQNEAQLNLFYQANLPQIQRIWWKLSLAERAQLWEALSHIRQYLKEFSMERERAYEKACDTLPRVRLAGKSHLQFHRPTRDYFVRYHPTRDFYKGNWQRPKPSITTWPYRRLETFCYRRIQEGVPVGQLLRLVEQLQSDLDFPTKGTFKQYDDNQQVLHSQVGIKRQQLHGVYQCKSSNRSTTGRYRRGTRVGTWVHELTSGRGRLEYRITIKYNQKGELVERFWQSYFANQLIYEIWLHVPSKKARFVNYSTKSKRSVTEFEGAFY